MKQTGFSAGAGLSCIILAVVTACGGSSGTGGSGGTGSTTSGSTTSKSTGTGPGATSTTSAGTTVSTGTGAGGGGCKPLGKLHPTDPVDGNNTIYCPFQGGQGGQGGGGTSSCDHTTEHCCAGKMNFPSSCDPKATACPPSNYTDFQCETASDCGANMDCCGDGIFKDGGMQNGMQCQNYASMMSKATCVAKGTCTTILMCNEKNATANPVQCPAGKDCTPFSKAGHQLGACE